MSSPEGHSTIPTQHAMSTLQHGLATRNLDCSPCGYVVYTWGLKGPSHCESGALACTILVPRPSVLPIGTQKQFQKVVHATVVARIVSGLFLNFGLGKRSQGRTPYGPLRTTEGYQSLLCVLALRVQVPKYEAYTQTMRRFLIEKPYILHIWVHWTLRVGRT